ARLQGLPSRTDLTSSALRALDDVQAAAQITEWISAPGHSVLLDRGVALITLSIERIEHRPDVDHPFAERTEDAALDSRPEVQALRVDAGQNIAVDVLEV